MRTVVGGKMFTPRKGGIKVVLSELIDGLGLLSAIFFGLGFILMIIEIYVPGFGIWGIAGITCFIVGIIVTAVTPIPPLSSRRGQNVLRASLTAL